MHSNQGKFEKAGRYLDSFLRASQAVSNANSQLLAVNALGVNCHLLAQPADLRVVALARHEDVVQLQRPERRVELPAASWELLSPHLYYTFWSLSLYDIFVPKERYESEVKRLRRQVEEIDRYQAPFGVSHADQDQKAAAVKRKKDKERCLTNQDKLKRELQEQTAHHKLVMARLKESNRGWFSEKGRSGAESINHFLQACVFPRCVFTPGDAVYCAKFVQHMHALGTPMFSTLQYYDKLLRDISVHTFCCTERQAKNLGNFLNASLAQLLHWKSHEDVYKEECLSCPASRSASSTRTRRRPRTRTTSRSSSSGTARSSSR